MTQLYFHCSNTDRVLIDPRGAAVGDLAEACEHAEAVMRALVMAPGAEDWRGWVLHVSDDSGDELFEVPFTSVVGRLH
jgi:uncharacterized protein DUF6894